MICKMKSELYYALKVNIIVIFSFLLNSLYAQDLMISWQACFGGSNTDEATDIIEYDSGFLLTGNTWSDDQDVTGYHGNGDAWLVKTDTAGNLIWQKTIGGSLSDGIQRVLKTNDNSGYFLAGGTLSSDGDISNNSYPGTNNFWIIRTDNSLNILWDKVYGGTGTDQLINIDGADDGGLICTGYSTSANGNISINYGGWDSWILKLDENGNVEWDFSIGTTGQDVSHAIIQTVDGGYLAGSSSLIEEQGNIGCTPHSWQSEAVIYKLNSNGIEQWHKCYGGTGHDGINSLIEVGDGYLIAGTGSSADGDLEGSGWHGESDFWIIKIDFNGSIIWQKCFGGSNTETPTKIIHTIDDGFIILGMTYSFDGDISFNPSLDSFRPSIWITKISESGELLWERCVGGIADEGLENGAIQITDNRLVVAGKMQYSPSFDVDCSQNENDGFYNFWLFEIADTNTLAADYHFASAKIQITPYPVPAGNSVCFEYKLPESKNNASIKIYDYIGRTVDIIPIKGSEGKVFWEVSGIVPGIYFFSCQIIDNLFTGKLVIK